MLVPKGKILYKDFDISKVELKEFYRLLEKKKFSGYVSSSSKGIKTYLFFKEGKGNLGFRVEKNSESFLDPSEVVFEGKRLSVIILPEEIVGVIGKLSESEKISSVKVENLEDELKKLKSSKFDGFLVITAKHSIAFIFLSQGIIRKSYYYNTKDLILNDVSQILKIKRKEVEIVEVYKRKAVYLGILESIIYYLRYLERKAREVYQLNLFFLQKAKDIDLVSKWRLENAKLTQKKLDLKLFRSIRETEPKTIISKYSEFEVEHERKGVYLFSREDVGKRKYPMALWEKLGISPLGDLDREKLFERLGFEIKELPRERLLRKYGIKEPEIESLYRLLEAYNITYLLSDEWKEKYALRVLRMRES
ncbi:MAG: DUF2226 domain-containing protein [Candidatus Methanofastidiosia archaeon]